MTELTKRGRSFGQHHSTAWVTRLHEKEKTLWAPACTTLCSLTGGAVWPGLQAPPTISPLPWGAGPSNREPKYSLVFLHRFCLIFSQQNSTCSQASQEARELLIRFPQTISGLSPRVSFLPVWQNWNQIPTWESLRESLAFVSDATGPGDESGNGRKNVLEKHLLSQLSCV